MNRITRRWFFEQCGVGLGAIALKTLLAESAQAAAQAPTDPLAPKPPQFPVDRGREADPPGKVGGEAESRQRNDVVLGHNSRNHEACRI